MNRRIKNYSEKIPTPLVFFLCLAFFSIPADLYGKTPDITIGQINLFQDTHASPAFIDGSFLVSNTSNLYISDVKVGVRLPNETRIYGPFYLSPYESRVMRMHYQLLELMPAGDTPIDLIVTTGERGYVASATSTVKIFPENIIERKTRRFYLELNSKKVAPQFFLKGVRSDQASLEEGEEVKIYLDYQSSASSSIYVQMLTEDDIQIGEYSGDLEPTVDTERTSFSMKAHAPSSRIKLKIDMRQGSTTIDSYSTFLSPMIIPKNYVTANNLEDLSYVSFLICLTSGLVAGGLYLQRSKKLGSK